jgi:anti-sigma factor RsiW
MWGLGGHLGSAVSALVDGQLDEESTERAWAHVHDCPACRRLVEREGWVKRQLAQMGGNEMGGNEPPPDLLGSLYELEPDEARDAWAAVDEIERAGRNRRRLGLALVGAGGVSAAVIGISALGGAPWGGSSGTPAASLTRGTPAPTPTRAVLAPDATAHGRLPGWTLRPEGHDGNRFQAVVADH